ncbi:MAG: SDR family NAD(P)-dependent oxidoreductase [Treponema sp.]|nr:SDR family NAD(P)-dependent oxidoreductase [Treponema sp.]
MQTKHLEGKVAWVTGSSRGLGQAIALQLAGAGASVVVHGSTMDSSSYFKEGASLAAVAEHIAQETGSRAMCVAGDLTQADVVKTLVKKIREEFGHIDILVNNAGGDTGSAGAAGKNAGKIVEGNDALFLPHEEIRVILDRNLMTCINACKEAVPAMMDKKEGWVVNIGSIAGMAGLVGAAIYATAKAAVHEYTRCLAALVRPHGVHVNCVAPGDTLSERFKASRPLENERMNQASLERYGWPVEIARAVEFLVSEGGSYITGQVIRVDGGRQIWAG